MQNQPEVIAFEGFFEIPEAVQPPIDLTPAEPPVVTAAEPEIEEIKEPEVSNNTWANLLKSMRDTDKILPDKLEIPDDLDPVKFKSLIYNSIKDEVLSTEVDIEAAKEKQISELHEKGYTKEQIEAGIRISQDINSGYSDESIDRYETLTYLGTTELTNQQDEITVIRKLLEIQGQEPLLIDAFIGQNFTPKEGEEEAMAEKITAASKKAQGGILQIRDNERQAESVRVQQAKAEQLQKQEKERNEVFRAIDAGNLRGVKLTKDEQEGLKKAMYEAKKQRIINTPEGPKTVYETQAQEAFRQLQSSPEGVAFLHYVVLYGAENIVSKANKEGSDKFMRAIEKEPQRPSLQDTTVSPTKTERKGYIMSLE